MQYCWQKFRAWEQHGEATHPKIIEILNFKPNYVNDHAFMFNKIGYDHFGQLSSALQDSLLLNKQSFKSAFKTLSAARNQA